MTSEVFHLDKDPGDDLDEVSCIDSDDENRDDEIKKLLEEGLSNETFDYDDSDTSFNNASKFSNHNNCSFVQDESVNNGRRTSSGSGGEREPPLLPPTHNEGLFETPRLPFMGSTAMKRVNFTELPNTIPEENENGNGTHLNGSKNHPNGNGGGDFRRGNGIDMNAMGQLFQENKTPENGNRNGVVERTQEQFHDLQTPNQTVSVLHNDHCPKNVSPGTGTTSGLGAGSWLSQEDQTSTEQLKQMCEFRERQIQRLEESIATFQKDKRALHHKMKLMESEMVQVKSQCEEAEKFAELKEEQVADLRSKLQEAIHEYEEARRNEVATKREKDRMLVEIEKLQQEVKLLSALGAQTQQAETNDVVRQIREKHAQEITSWQKIVHDLESQLRAFKRTQRFDMESSSPKLTAETQTEFQIEDEIGQIERELAVQEFREELGACSESFLDDLRQLPEKDIKRRVLQEWKTERGKLVNHYESEINIYKQKLSTLPRELYEKWKKAQEELGLNESNQVVIRKSPPPSNTVGTNTEDKLMHPKTVDHSTSFNTSVVDANDVDEKEKSIPVLTDQGVQVNIIPQTVSISSSTSFVEPVVKQVEKCSTLVQTKETVESYQMLEEVMERWENEVRTSKQRAHSAETKTQEVQDQLKLLAKKFKEMQKVAVTCRREWKRQEESLRSQLAQVKAHYVDTLQKVSDKLTLVDQIDVDMYP